MPRAFVVDDDQMVCVAIEVCLPRQGFEVTVADGGEAGMRALEASEFDVTLIDVFMPDFLRMTIEPRGGMLSAQAVHAERAVDQRQRMPHQINTVRAALEKMK